MDFSQFSDMQLKEYVTLFTEELRRRALVTTQPQATLSSKLYRLTLTLPQEGDLRVPELMTTLNTLLRTHQRLIKLDATLQGVAQVTPTSCNITIMCMKHSSKTGKKLTNILSAQLLRFYPAGTTLITADNQ